MERPLRGAGLNALVEHLSDDRDDRHDRRCDPQKAKT